jgi:hypothetical protein
MERKKVQRLSRREHLTNSIFTFDGIKAYTDDNLLKKLGGSGRLLLTALHVRKKSK